ncbi:ArsR/SmtB family transcription factor [Macrococcus lamae]|uniref:Transcriptional regulator n=1 Tax=Macrococcus lamae TaxID=198484 RepID=A0A4R6BS83_9STAP|nr:metalloregulator ArsR/SmtB family transcription factor [Macrococcus lamae]TDM05213.1 transcriptional regulator [Macrococcus lamae]
MTADTCDIVCVNEDKVQTVKSELARLPMSKVTTFLKAIADENRSKIVSALSTTEELCVCDIACILELSIANASRHLRILYKQGVLKSRREGKMVYYSLDDDHVKQIILMTIAHMEESL